jgi:uncharacterized protein (TIGR02145 family)
MKTFLKIILTTILQFMYSCESEKDIQQSINLNCYAEKITASTLMINLKYDLIGDYNKMLEISEIGICWSTNENPTITENQLKLNINNEVLKQSNLNFNEILLTNLLPNTKYYYCGFVKSKSKYIYGDVSSTLTASGMISFESHINCFQNSNYVKIINSIITDSVTPLIDFGICYGLHSQPNIKNDSIFKLYGWKYEEFMADIVGLYPSTKYFFRLFAINELGTFYGKEFTYTTTEKVTDIDGNIYNTVQFGDQLWTVENLKTEKYNDGTQIRYNTVLFWDDDLYNVTSGLCCGYKNYTQNITKYGLLYNSYAVSTGKLAPKGWHIPNNNEWKKLIYFLENIYERKTIARELASSEYWTSWRLEYTPGNNLKYNNSSGFNGLPGGYIDANYEEDYLDLGYRGYWWSSTKYNSIYYNVWNLAFSS